MTSQVLLAFVLFSFSIAMVPGAGNIALLGMSNRFGVSATLPFIAGNTVGVILIILAASAGLVGVMHLYPTIFSMLKWLGTAYLIYLAWTIITLNVEDEITDNHAGFGSGILIQLLNPKGYIISLTIFSQFISDTAAYLPQVALMTTIMALTGAFGMVLWAYFGTMLQRVIQSPGATKAVNGLLGGSLAIVAIMMAVQPL
ncbi:LysE family translocator [Vibrio sp. FNV 38]|nr:LysE family translocator [Vibrio sp. FNV 38]